jgi:nucleoside-triphosphatase THEP1
VEQDGKTVKFVINVENPDKQSERTIKHKHFLPEEVRSEHVVDNQGFDVRFDDAVGKAYLSKEEILQPAEQKRYVIQIKDIWQFPTHKLENVTERADIALKELKDSVYVDSGQYLYDDITEKVEQIEAAQGKTAASITEHIGLYRVNMKRFEDAKEALERLEQMMAVIRAAKLEELESKKVKNVLSRLQSLRGLKALSEAVFKRGIKVTTTWKIILGTIFFLTIFTTLHFVLWAQRSRKMGEEKGLKEGEDFTKITSPQETI